MGSAAGLNDNSTPDRQFCSVLKLGNAWPLELSSNLSARSKAFSIIGGRDLVSRFVVASKTWPTASGGDSSRGQQTFDYVVLSG